MKIAVSGGAGFIGQHTVKRLISDGATPVVFDRHWVNLPDKAEPFLGDIKSKTDVTELIGHVDGWINLAGVLGSAEAVMNPFPAAETNILGALNVFEAAAQYKIPGIQIAVGNAVSMDNTYSISKHAAARFARMYNVDRGTSISIVKALNAYGPGQASVPPYGVSPVKKIMPAFINAAIRNLPVEVYGTGENVMDMVFVEDVAKALCEALYITMDLGPIHAPIEIGTGRATTVNEIAQAVIDVADSKSEIVHIPMRMGEPEGAVVLGNVSTLKNIGMHPCELKTLEEGLECTIEWFKRDQSFRRVPAADGRC